MGNEIQAVIFSSCNMSLSAWRRMWGSRNKCGEVLKYQNRVQSLRIKKMLEFSPHLLVSGQIAVGRRSEGAAEDGTAPAQNPVSDPA